MERLDRDGTTAWTERDWSLAMPLRDRGLIAPQPHPFWRFVPLVGPYKQRVVLTWLGRRALEAASP